MKYIVMVQIDEYGDMTGEYTGIEYDNREDARKEFLQAKDDVQVFSAWIEER